MVLKMAQILNAYNWAASMRSKNIPYTAAFLIASNLNNMETDMKNFENQKMSMLEQYGKKDSDGNLIVHEDNSVELEDKESFAKEFNKLLECEVEVTINKIPIEEVKDLSISIEQMKLISFLFASNKTVTE